MPINLIKVIKMVEFIKHVQYFISPCRWCVVLLCAIVAEVEYEQWTVLTG